VLSERDLENQVRGLLKNLGLVIGRTEMKAFVGRRAELIEAQPELASAIEPLLKAGEAVEKQIADLDRKAMLRKPRRDLSDDVRRNVGLTSDGVTTGPCRLDSPICSVAPSGQAPRREAARLRRGA
jgi:transposase